MEVPDTERTSSGSLSDENSRVNLGPQASNRLGILKVLAAFIGFQVVAVAAVVAAEIVPDRLIIDSLLDGVDRGWVDTTHHPTTGLDNRVDRWTECYALTIGLGDAPGSSFIESAITSPQLGKCELSVPTLLAHRDGAPLVSEYDYYRYWHGYSIISRPSLAILGVAGARMIAMALVATTIVLTAMSVARDTSLAGAIVLVAPAFVTSDLIDIAESLPHALATAACWGAAFMAWQGLRNKRDLRRVATISVVAGSASAFFDLMVLIPGTMALVTTLVVVSLWTHTWRGRRLFLAGLLAGGTWILGFVGTWMMKWVVASVFVGFDDVVRNVTEQVLFRVAGEHTAVADVFGVASRMNVDYWLQRPLGFLVPVGVIVALSLAIRAWRKGIAEPSYLVLLLGLAMAPLVWYEVLSSHSQIHFWITYKSLPLAFGALLFALVVANTSVTHDNLMPREQQYV
jgi:hypothetical protein